MTKSLLAGEFLTQALSRFNESYPRIEKCLSQLTEAEVWKRPNENSNSIGNLILHLCGNIRQYIISGLGSKADTRQRDSEFAATGGITKEELLKNLKDICAASSLIIQDLSDEDLSKQRVVQGFHLTGIGIIIHVVEHYSYHTGQITFWTKLLKDIDTGYYAGQDLNK